MEKNVIVLPAETPFQELLARTDLPRGLTHLVVTRGGRIASVQRINAGMRQGQGAAGFAVKLGAIGHRDFTVARADDIMYDVIGRMARRKASMAVIVRGSRRIPRAEDVVGVVTKEHVADSVAETVKAYPQGS
jgi:CIC family chloride channel protein